MVVCAWPPYHTHTSLRLWTAHGFVNACDPCTGACIAGCCLETCTTPATFAPFSKSTYASCLHSVRDRTTPHADASRGLLHIRISTNSSTASACIILHRFLRGAKRSLKTCIAQYYELHCGGFLQLCMCAEKYIFVNMRCFVSSLHDNGQSNHTCLRPPDIRSCMLSTSQDVRATCVCGDTREHPHAA